MDVLLTINDSMSSKKIELKDHAFHLRYHLLYLIVAGIYVFYLISSNGKHDLVEYLMQAVFIIAITLIPSIIIHLNYFFINRNDRFEIDNKLIVFCKESKSYEMPLEHIIKVTCYMTNNFAEKNTPWLPWENYHFFVIQTGSDYFIVTSLLYPKLHEVLPIAKEKIVIIKDWFPLTSMYTPDKGLKS